MPDIRKTGKGVTVLNGTITYINPKEKHLVFPEGALMTSKTHMHEDISFAESVECYHTSALDDFDILPETVILHVINYTYSEKHRIQTIGGNKNVKNIILSTESGNESGRAGELSTKSGNESGYAGELSCVLHSAAEPSFAGEAATESGNESSRAEELAKTEQGSYLKSIDGVVYSSDGSILIRYPAGRTGHFDIPEGVKIIGERAFKNSALESVSFPNSLRRLKEKAFYWCKNLKRIDFGDGITNIGDKDVPAYGDKETLVFAMCNSLTTIKFPKQVTEIGDGAFCRCKNLEKVIFPEGLKIIHQGAFWQCTKLKDVTLPDSLEIVANGNFQATEIIRCNRVPHNLLHAQIQNELNKFSQTQEVTEFHIGDDIIFMPKKISIGYTGFVTAMEILIYKQKEKYSETYQFAKTAFSKYSTAVKTCLHTKNDKILMFLEENILDIAAQCQTRKDNTLLRNCLICGVKIQSDIAEELLSYITDPVLRGYILEHTRSGETEFSFTL